MTKSKTKTRTRRFSGPELGPLLEEVVAEHGPSAEILEVAKVRSGGVAGFFCREEYEITVDVSQPASSSTKKPTKPESAGNRSARPKVAAPTAGDINRAQPEPQPAATDRFMAALERRLEETAEVDITSAPAIEPAPVQEEVVSIEPVAPARRTPVVGATELVAPRPGPLPPLAAVPIEPDGFWTSVGLARQRLQDRVPSVASFLAVIGPLSLTTPIIGRLGAEPSLAEAETIVLTDRAEIVSEPEWQLVRSGHQLVDAANERAGAPTLLVIDVPVELPQWVAPLQHRLRLAGVDMFRYVIPGTPSVQRLEQYRSGPDVPYLIDLASRVEPDRFIEFVALQHPIASVGGVPLTAELLVAAQEQVDRGR